MTASHPPIDTAPFRILAVCTGNVCRSPAVQLLLAHHLGPSVVVESAGTGALVDSPVEPPMAALLDAQGISSAGFAARSVTEDMISRADVVLALTRAHRALVVELVPSAVRRTFTLREFASLLRAVADPRGTDAATPGERLRAMVTLAASNRSRMSGRPQDLDVPDPFGRPVADYEHAMQLIRQAVLTISRIARGSTHP